MTLEERVKKVIVDKLEVAESEVTPDAAFMEDLNADSLALLELVMAFEEEFGIEIPDEEVEKIRKVSDAISYVERATA